MNEDTEIDDMAPFLALVITLIGLGMRVLLLETKGLWLDEAISAWAANQGVAEMVRWTAQIDSHPPLYYLLLHNWLGLVGESTYTLRMLSALFGAATIPVVYLTGRRLSGSAMGLAAALLLAVSPFNIRYAQEARMYTLLTFNATVAIYALVRLLTDARSTLPIGTQFWNYLRAWRSPAPVEPEDPRDFSYRDLNRPKSGWRAWFYKHHWLPIREIETDLAWVAFIVFSALTLLSHNTAVLFPLATNIFVLGFMLYQKVRGGKPSPQMQASGLHAPTLANWIKAQVGILILWGPWIVPFFRQVSRVYAEFWIQPLTLTAVSETLIALVNENTPRQTQPSLILWVLYVPVVLLALVHFRKNLGRLALLAVLCATPIVGELILSIWRPVFLDRTLIWATIPLFLALGAGVAQFKRQFLVLGVVGILATYNIFSASDYFRWWRKEDWFNPAGYVANFVEENDLVLFNTIPAQIPFDYYFHVYEDLYRIEVEKHGVPVDLFERGVFEVKMTEAEIPWLIELVEGHDRVWLVYSHESYSDPDGLVTQTLAGEMTLMLVREYWGVTLMLYER